jgi:hypothetical protein
MKEAGSRPFRNSLRRDAAVALGLIVVIAVLLALGGASTDGREDSAASSRRYRDSRDQVEATIPAGWRALRRPIDGIVYPPQVLAAASFPVAVPRAPKGCHPGKVLGQMPRNGVLLQIFEYAARDSEGKPLRVPGLPPRPGHFRYSDASFGPFECAGLSHKFEFDLEGRAFQAHIWLDRTSVAPQLRAQALKILDSFTATPR